MRRNPSGNNIKSNQRFRYIQGKGENLFIFRVYYFIVGVVKMSEYEGVIVFGIRLVVERLKFERNNVIE